MSTPDKVQALYKRIKQREDAGCKLDAGNLGSLAYMWHTFIGQHKKLFDAVYEDVTNKDRDGYQALKKHDQQLLLALRTWAQSTRIIGELIDSRVRELESIYLQAKEAGVDIPGITDNKMLQVASEQAAAQVAAANQPQPIQLETTGEQP